jgi:hypothetical protein
MRIALVTALSALLACVSAFGQAKALVPPGPAAGPAVAMKPGLWELTTVVETAGSATKRTVVGRACYSPADVADIHRVIPQQREFGMQCENRDAKAQGPSTSWTVVCTSKEATLNGNAKMSVASTSYTGKAELELKKRGAKPVKVEQTVSGKWLEACK